MHETTDLTGHWVGFLCLGILVAAYSLVVTEEYTHFKKSKPVLFAAGLIWFLIAFAHRGTEYAETVGEAVRHNILEYAEILLFLLVAMSYINVLEDRKVFEALRSRLVTYGLSFRSLFWLTGLLAFSISPIADNMTTALLMGAVVIAVGRGDVKFVAPACINIVVAANAGGAFSPFGDITTLMVWQAEKVEFATFFHLFPASFITWVVPAALMSFAIPSKMPEVAHGETIVHMLPGAKRTMVLFGLTIATAVFGHNTFHLPPVLGMLFGLAYLKVFGYFLEIRATEDNPFDVLHHVQRIEWDTLLFFGGIILSVGGIGYIGYLELLSHAGYQAWGPFTTEQSIGAANILVGMLSAIIDNIPLMFAVLTMDPTMSQWQWLLVTLTAGVGGSMLSIGSAAGVALMGSAPKQYTFMSHLRFTPVIFLGYVAGIVVHYYYAQFFATQLFNP